MGDGLSVSASNHQGTGGISLIWCTKCGGEKVLKRTSRKEWSLGEVFYCCPNYKRDGTDCSFWFWEEDYIKEVEKEAEKNGVHGARPTADEVKIQADAGTSMMQAGSGCKCVGLVNEQKELVAIGKEIVSVLRAICFVCVCMLLVMVASVVVMIFK
ncbi:unnamed protein product [Urochloa humidicola]